MNRIFFERNRICSISTEFEQNLDRIFFERTEFEQNLAKFVRSQKNRIFFERNITTLFSRTTIFSIVRGFIIKTITLVLNKYNFKFKNTVIKTKNLILI